MELVAQRDTALGACNGLREKIERMNFKDEWKKKRAAGYDYGREALEQVKFGFEIALEALR